MSTGDVPTPRATPAPAAVGRETIRARLPTTDPARGATGGSDRLALLVAGDGVFATHSLPATGSVVIGRLRENDVFIDNDSLSRRHAILHLDPPLRIEDGGSANGTFVGDHRLAAGETTPIQLNEAIRIGPVTIIVQRRSTAVVTRRLHSHDYFESRVEEECSRAARTGRQVVVIHVVVAAGVGARAQPLIAGCLREADVLAEYAPGQFEALLLDAEPAQIDVVVDRITGALAGQQLTSRIARGVYPRDGRDATALLRSIRGEVHDDVGPDAEGAASMIVADEKMSALHALVARVAGGDINVLLLGETGVGKEVVAEAVHRQSKRATKPFLRLNCAAFTETLLESELFGHERGSFTGADRAKPGLFEVAAGGTVFLDEVGELPAATQVKLLRVLDDRKVMRVGGIKPISLDVRLVSATNRDLEREAQRGAFRLDLLYRLNSISIVLPPLRERPAEVEPLARHFVRRFAAARGIRPPRISADALKLMIAYSWPGNVRELKNVVERALILCDGVEVQARDLPAEKMASTFTLAAGRRMTAPPMPATPPTTPFAPAAPAPAPQTDAEAAAGRRPTSPPPLVGPGGFAPRAPRGGDRAQIVAALEACAGNQTHAAAMLGVSRRTLINWIERMEIPRPRKR